MCILMPRSQDLARPRSQDLAGLPQRCEGGKGELTGCALLFPVATGTGQHQEEGVGTLAAAPGELEASDHHPQLASHHLHHHHHLSDNFNFRLNF